jgi:glycosyltransferase involved in cell wall biosynthesis
MRNYNSTPTLFVVNAISGGGAENSIMNISTQLLEKNLPVTVCAINGSGSIPSDHIYILHRKWKAGFVETARNYLEFSRLVRQLRPKIIVANCELPELYVAFATPRKVRIVCVEHTSKPWAGRRALGILIRKILRFRGAYWISVTSEEAVWQGSLSPKYIANPITIEKDAMANDHQETETIFIGRLRLEKRPDWVISSATQADLRVDIFGEGDLKEALQSTYSDHSATIRFHGYVSNPWRFISKNAIVVVPSEYEGDGMVVAEAIMRNHPVLLADNPDLRRFALPNENYFLNAEELKSKLIVWKQSGKNAFHIPGSIVKSLHKTRDVNTIVEQWEVLLNNLKQEQH